MRWKHPTLGLVPPVRFIPIAEANGLINLLGAWALKAVPSTRSPRAPSHWRAPQTSLAALPCRA